MTGVSHSSRVSIQEWVVMAILGTTLILASLLKWWTLSLTEVLGFVTGGICVWLVVREHVWNWPVGLANNVFFFFLFLKSRLYGDMWLQVVYFGLGLWGWVNWLFGGEHRTELRISRCNSREWLVILILLPIGTMFLQQWLLAANGAAPFWDAFTTVLSLIAQYLLCRKRLENWFFWIAADIIYVPLYLSRDLPLTAVLYGVFLGMCLKGWCSWQTTWKRTTSGRSSEAS